MLADLLTAEETERLAAGIPVARERGERSLTFPPIPDGCPARQRSIILERRAEHAGIDLEARKRAVGGDVTDADVENLRRASRIARTL